MPEASDPAGPRAGDRGPGPTPSGTGLEPNVAGALCYLLGLITGVLFLILDRGRPSVRFHAYQSIAVSVGWIVLSVVASIFGIIPFIGWIIGALLGLALTVGGLVLWLYLMWQAFQGNQPELPVVGPWARSQAGGGATTL